MALNTNNQNGNNNNNGGGTQSQAQNNNSGSNQGGLGYELDMVGSDFNRISGTRSETLEALRLHATKVCSENFEGVSVFTLSPETGFTGVFPATLFALNLKNQGKDLILLYPLVHELAHVQLEPQKQQYGNQQIEISRNIGDVLNDTAFLKHIINTFTRLANVSDATAVDIAGINFIPAKQNFSGVGTDAAVTQLFNTTYLAEIFQVLQGIVMHSSGKSPKVNLATAKGNLQIRHEFEERTIFRANGLPTRVGQTSVLEYIENNTQNNANSSFAVSNSSRTVAKVSSYVDFINRGSQTVAPGQAPLPPLVPNVVITDFNNGSYTEPRGLIYAILTATGLYDNTSYPWMNAFRNILPKGKNQINYRDLGVMGLDRNLAPLLGANEPGIINTAGFKDHEIKNLLARVVDLNAVLFSIDVDSISTNSFINTTIHAAAGDGDVSKKANDRLIGWANDLTNGEFVKTFPAGEKFFIATSLVFPRGYVPAEGNTLVDVRNYDYLGRMNLLASIAPKDMNAAGNDYATELHNIFSNGDLHVLDRFMRFQNSLRGVETYYVCQTMRYFINPKAIAALVTAAQKALKTSGHDLINKTQINGFSSDSSFVSKFIGNALTSGLSWGTQFQTQNGNYGYNNGFSGNQSWQSGKSGIL